MAGHLKCDTEREMMSGTGCCVHLADTCMDFGEHCCALHPFDTLKRECSQFFQTSTILRFPLI